MKSRIAPPYRLLVAFAALPLIAVGLFVTSRPSSADTTPSCPSVSWSGATAAGQDRAYRVAAPPGPYQDPPDWSPAGTTTCYLGHTVVTATSDRRPVHLVAGYQLDDRNGDGGYKSLVYVMIECYDESDTRVFWISANTNIFTGAGRTGFYPRALFYPPAAGTYDCAARISNAYMGQSPKPVYVLSGYLSKRVTTNVTGQHGAVHAGEQAPDFPNGKSFVYLPRGSNTQLRRVQLTVPAGVTTLQASSNVNFTKCSWSDYNAGRCPQGSYSNDGQARFRLRIVAWQTKPGGTTVCRYIAPPDAAVPWGYVGQDRHHMGLKVDATMTLTDDPACTRTVVMKTYLELAASSSYDAGFVYSQNTVLSGYGR